MKVQLEDRGTLNKIRKNSRNPKEEKQWEEALVNSRDGEKLIEWITNQRRSGIMVSMLMISNKAKQFCEDKTFSS